MIDSLIEKIASNEIETATALNQAKIIASKIKNDDFKQWINHELKGYPQEFLNQLPDYRIFSVQIRGDIIDQWGIPNEDILFVMDDFVKQFNIDDPYKHYERQNISTIEHAVKNAPGQFVVNPFNPKFIGMMNEVYQQVNPGVQITSVGRHIALSNLRNVIVQVNQRLLDTLLELKEEFPDFEDGFEASDKNKSKAQNIVNLNIYGGTANTNLGVGDSVIQKDITFTNKVEQTLNKLKELGVPDEDLTEAEQIIKSTPKTDLSKKLMTWVGKLSGKMIEKGIELKLPEIIETVQDFI